MRCVLCRSSKTNLLDFGPVHYIDNGELSVHQNCLYLSSGLVQRGDDDNGTLHFLTEDIIKESRRIRHLACCYCHLYGANIGCCSSKCHRTFHTGCGIKNNAQNQFCETYKSYCNYHVRTHQYRPKKKENCVICYEQLIKTGEKFNFMTVINSPCCRNGWYHRTCLQAYANSSGYFFKCPLCNNSETFRDVSYWNIAIPNSDAAWELEPDAFREQTQRDLTCTAEKCLNPKGRKSNNELDLCYCNSCGSNPVHIRCKNEEVYNCNVCAEASNSLEDPLDSFYMSPRPQIANRSYNTTRNDGIMITNPNRNRVKQKLRAPSSDFSNVDVNSDSDDDAIFSALAGVGKENDTKKQITMDLERQDISTSSNPLKIMPDYDSSNIISTESINSVRSSSRIRAKIAQVKATPMDTEFVARRTRSRSHIVRPFCSPESFKTQPRTSRRHTSASSISQSDGSIDSTKSPVLDISCVANRTRQRLPVYLANQK